MPMVAWMTYVRDLPVHVNEDVLQQTTVTAFPYLEKGSREQFLRRLEGATEEPRRRLGKEEYAAQVAALGHVKLVEVSKGGS